VHALAELDDDWVDAYCVLYDAIWAVECALTQRYIDLRRQYQISDLDPTLLESDETFEQLYHQRSSLIVSTFQFKGPIIPPTDLMESLAINLLAWDTSLDQFLSQQDSLLQHRMSLPQAPLRILSYGKHIDELRPYTEAATRTCAEWMTSRKAGASAQSGNPRSSVEPDGTDASVITNIHSRPGDDDLKAWVTKMASANASLYSQPLDGPDVPLYLVDCPKLHAIPRKYIAYQLRWSDKWAYESIQGDASFVNWKEGVQCPSCASGAKIKCARLLEPLHNPSVTTKSTAIHHTDDQSQHSEQTMNSNTATSNSTTSQHTSDHSSLINSFPGQSTIHTIASQTHSDPGIARSTTSQLPQYTESPISPTTFSPSSYSPRPYGSSMSDYPISPLTESFDLALPEVASSRLSMNLPIPVHTPSTTDLPTARTSISIAAPSSSRIRPDPSSPSLTWNATSHTTTKPASRSARFSSMRRKPTTKDKDLAQLPKEPLFAFSSSGRSSLLWGKASSHVTRFDMSVSESSIQQGCKYVAEGLEAAAAGERKCVIIAAKNASKKRLMVFNGMNTIRESEVELEVTGKAHEISVAVSKDDKHVAISLNDQIDMFCLEGGLRRVAFHQQPDVYELRDSASTPSVIRPPSSGPAPDDTKIPASKDAAEDQETPTSIISRKLYFSTDSQRLVVATQLSSHSVSLDVWDIARAPISPISQSRSFKLPPRVLNDGDLTSVFYDPTRRAALVTAFISKEYPLLIPFPGYAALQNETFSTKIVAAAQSPSGSVFVVANAMTEIIMFEYTAKGAFAPRKLKKASSKISSSVFKPGAIVLGMPAEDVLKVFWIREGRCMLRTIRLGMTEGIQDVDIRGKYDELISRSLVGTPSVGIAELDGG
jgi:hypothetical protein